MIYNYTRCESVIAKIMADLDSTEARLKTSDIREWIFEAVEKIGAPMQYISRESGSDGLPILKIQDHQVPIPADMHTLDAVAYSKNPNGPWVPMSTMTGIFKEPKRKPKHHIVNTTLPHDPNNKTIHDEVRVMPEHQPEARKLFTSLSQFYTINGMKYIDKINHYALNDVPEYFIKPGWIVTNKSDGYIKLAYKAIAVDERGYPLIPDLPSYQEAIYWYVTMKLSYPKLLKGKLGGKGVNTGMNLYNDMRMLWNYYRNQAYGEALMPTADDMQNIKNDWNKLIPDWDGDDTFFKYINKDQQFYTDYYYGY